MRDTNLSNDGAKHLIGAAKVQAIDSLEREKQHRPLVHPLAAQRSILGDLQSFKHRLTVPADVKKVGQHAHAHGFPKPAGTSDEGHFCCLLLQQVSDKSRLVHIVIVVLPDLRKVRNPDRDLQISHARGPLPIAPVWFYDTMKPLCLQAYKKSGQALQHVVRLAHSQQVKPFGDNPSVS